MEQHVAIGAERYTRPTVPSATQTRVGQSTPTSHRHRATQSSSVCHTPDVPARTTQQAIATSKYRALHRHRTVAPYASSDNKHSLATPERVNHTLVATTDVLLSCLVAFRPRNRARFTINTMHPARQTNTRGV